MTTYDVIVAGAGPGGATAAAVAARAGLRVLLVDRARFPRDKVCGDALSGKTVDVMNRLGITDAVATASSVDSWGVLFGSPGGSEVVIPFAEPNDEMDPPGYLCAREIFDELVVQCAVEEGADLCEQTVVEGLIRSGERVTGVRLREGTSRRDEHARVVIGADGAYSAVARALGFVQLDARHYYAGVRGYYRGVTGFRPGNVIELHFVEEAIPGYFWIFPMADGMVNVGMGTLSARIKRKDVRLKEVLRTTVESPRFRARFERSERIGPVRGWGMPLGSSPRPMAGAGWMLVGDAASLIDPFTGEGIGNAMLSGEMAGRWAARAREADDASAAFLQSYERDVHRALDAELRLSYTLRRLERWRWLLDTVIRKAERNPEVAWTISSMFNDLGARERLTSPLFYLRLLMS
ncbi:MAG: geranylgeranyl reductase family protein [Rhodothermales bacterium]